MNIWGFLTGLILGILPLVIMLKIFKGKLLFFGNPYLKGAIFGFFLWSAINILIYFEVRYTILGLTEMEEGFSTVVLLTSSLQGFITAGLIAAFLAKHLPIKKSPKS